MVAACSSSTIAIGQAADLILDGELDAAICGGTDALARLTFSGFNALRLMDPEPCKPFDKARAGMSIGEGAAILVLEDMARAKARGATIYAELAGYGLSCEAYHATAPEPEGRAVGGMIRARARERAASTPDEVDHVNCHGTATPQNDRAEARGLHVVFGDRARRLPVNSIKSMIGHCLGTAGAIEAAVAGADDQARRHPADDQPRHHRSRVRRRRRRQRGARGAGPLRRLDVARLRRQRRGAGDEGGLNQRRVLSWTWLLVRLNEPQRRHALEVPVQ